MHTINKFHYTVKSTIQSSSCKNSVMETIGKKYSNYHNFCLRAIQLCPAMSLVIIQTIKMRQFFHNQPQLDLAHVQ